MNLVLHTRTAQQRSLTAPPRCRNSPTLGQYKARVHFMPWPLPGRNKIISVSPRTQLSPNSMRSTTCKIRSVSCLLKSVLKACTCVMLHLINLCCTFPPHTYTNGCTLGGRQHGRAPSKGEPEGSKLQRSKCKPAHPAVTYGVAKTECVAPPHCTYARFPQWRYYVSCPVLHTSA